MIGMRKNVVRAAAFVMSAVMSAALISSCGEKKVSSDGVKTLSLYMISEAVPYDPDLPIWKQAEEKTGIRLENTVSDVVTDENTTFSTMLISSKLPDIVRSANKRLRTMAKDGGLIAIDEYFEYAPNLKNFFEECPVAKNVATLEDGHIYFVPGTTTDLDLPDTPSMGFFIRQDWLNKLGLKTPTTIQELHDVLYTFKTQDPNGNGIADEVPYFSRFKWINELLYLYGVKADYFIKDGVPVYGPITEEYKDGIKEYAKWYSEGIIDPEIYSRNQPREQLLGQNLGGCTVDWFSSTGKFNESYADAVPGLDFSAMLPPENINGKVEWYDTRGVLHDYAWGISKDCDEDDIIDAVKYLDFWMSEEGCNLMAYGVEGLSYTKGDNGEIIWSEEAQSYPDGLPNYRRSIGFTEVGTVGIMEAEKAGMNDSALEGYEMYEDIVVDIGVKNVNFTDSEQDIYDKYNNDITTYMNEQQQKWIMGKGDIDAEWDAYVQKLNSMGLEELTGAYTSAYERYKKDFLSE